MIKVKLKRFLAITMALSMVFSTNAFATPITLTDSAANASETDTLDKTNGTDHFADEDTNNWSKGQITEEVRVNVDRASFFDITIPKEIVLNGNDGSASYEVSITGELAGDQALVVKPDDSFTLTEDGGKTTPVTVEQDKDTFNYQDINNSVKGNGTLSASGISAGNWSGSFYFNIEFKKGKKDFSSSSVEPIILNHNGEIVTFDTPSEVYWKCPGCHKESGHLFTYEADAQTDFKENHLLTCPNYDPVNDRFNP